MCIYIELMRMNMNDFFLGFVFKVQHFETKIRTKINLEANWMDMRTLYVQQT